MNSTAVTTVDLSALKHNLHLIRQMMPRQKIMAMVKSNAYGHGIIRVAKALKNVDAFGVATIAEALQLRDAGVDNDIVVMRGLVTAEEITVFLENNRLIACIHDDKQLALLEQNHIDNDRRLR